VAAVAVIITIVFLIAVFAFPALTRTTGGKVYAFFPLFVLPIAAASLGGFEHLERSKQTQFCLSCHTMSEHGKSLYVDDPTYLPASHFQNHRVPPDKACYTCHTDYTMYGDINAKMRGLRHVYVQYLGTIPRPSDIRLYEPYNNRECLYCHQGARTFEEGVSHTLDAETLPAIKSNQMSCMSGGCHEIVHEVGTVSEQKMWTPPSVPGQK
jgi:nitrate/TMAO reductase-like tetraheme cytochrome c subunit